MYCMIQSQVLNNHVQQSQYNNIKHIKNRWTCLLSDVLHKELLQFFN